MPTRDLQAEFDDAVALLQRVTDGLAQRLETSTRADDYVARKRQDWKAAKAPEQQLAVLGAMNSDARAILKEHSSLSLIDTKRQSAELSARIKLEEVLMGLLTTRRRRPTSKSKSKRP